MSFFHLENVLQIYTCASVSCVRQCVGQFRSLPVSAFGVRCSVQRRFSVFVQQRFLLSGDHGELEPRVVHHAAPAVDGADVLGHVLVPGVHRARHDVAVQV